MSWCVGLFWVAIAGLVAVQGGLLFLFIKRAVRSSRGARIDALWAALPAVLLAALALLTWLALKAVC